MKKFKILTCNSPTLHSGRMYPKEEVEKAVERYRKKIDSGIAYGELENRAQPNIALADISHRVTDMFFEGDDLYANVEILDTFSGKVVKQLIDEQIPVRLSPVGAGDVDEETSTVKEFEFYKTSFVVDDGE